MWPSEERGVCGDMGLVHVGFTAGFSGGKGEENENPEDVSESCQKININRAVARERSRKCVL